MSLLGEKEESGTIFAVAGRKDKENLNLADDKSYIVISAKTQADGNMSFPRRRRRSKSFRCD